MCSLEVSASENHLWSNIQWHDEILTTSRVHSHTSLCLSLCYTGMAIGTDSLPSLAKAVDLVDLSIVNEK